jgi:DNA-binding transcriptional LysR family regulator
MPIASTRTVELFVAAVEAGNFSRAASRLGLTPAAVSRAIGRLEAELGLRLFRRTTRQMRLTSEGQLYFERCRQALGLIEQAERELTERQETPRGLVRLSVPTTYGHSRALPALARLLDSHPDVSLEIDVSNRNVDFVTEGYDLAIRAGELADSELVAHRLEEATLGVFASPDYLARRGTPRSADDFARHILIGFVRPSSGRIMPWLFRRPDGTQFAVTPADAVRCSDDFLGCLTMARHGAGLLQAFHFLVEEDLARGTLVELLRGLAGRSRPFTLLQAPRRTPTAAVRVVVDALLADARARAGTGASPARPRAPRRSS